MLQSTENLPPEVTLPVPRAYRDYLRHGRAAKGLLTLVFYLLVLGFYYYLWRHGRTGIELFPHLIVLIMSALALFVTTQTYKSWQYTVDGMRIKLVLWQWRDKVWEWHGLAWRQDVILDVQKDEWRGLPALRVRAKLKGYKTPQDLWLVYAHEDADTVQNVVLPLVEQYRQQYRHPLWADTLRQENKL